MMMMNLLMNITDCHMCKCFPSFDQKTCDSLMFVYLNYCFVAVNITGLTNMSKIKSDPMS